MLEGAKWHPISESGNSSCKTMAPLLYLKIEQTIPTVAHNQCWFHCRVLLSLLVCLVWCEYTWGPIILLHYLSDSDSLTVRQTWQALTSSCSVHSSCHTVLFTVYSCSMEKCPKHLYRSLEWQLLEELPETKALQSSNWNQRYMTHS